jgi:ketosteroid isomerase-like protein
MRSTLTVVSIRVVRATSNTDDLAHRFLAATEARDVAALGTLLDPDGSFWNNVIGKPMTTAQVLEVARLEAERVDEYAFHDVRVTSTPDGFVAQFTAVGATKNGDSFQVPVCLVMRANDDRIVAIDEYVDSQQAAPLFAALLGN